MLSTLVLLLSLSVPALATVFATSPVASSKFSGGKPAQVSWQDDGSAPTLKDFGPAIVSIYVGNALQQTSLQTITPSVDVSTTSSIQFTPDPTIGPNSNNYFIRFQSISLKDPKQPQYPALAFSAQFSLDSMTGTFNASVQAQIAGQSTAPIGGATSAAASSPSAAAKPTGANSISVAGSASKAASASASSTSKPANGAMGVHYGAAKGIMVATVGMLAGVLLF